MHAIRMKFRDHLPAIAVFLFAGAVCWEQLFPGMDSAACFVKGLACGLGAVGAVRLAVRSRQS